MWGKAIVVVLLAVLANFYLGGRTVGTERPSDAAKGEKAEKADRAEFFRSSIETILADPDLDMDDESIEYIRAVTEQFGSSIR